MNITIVILKIKTTNFNYVCLDYIFNNTVWNKSRIVGQLKKIFSKTEMASSNPLIIGSVCVNG